MTDQAPKSTTKDLKALRDGFAENAKKTLADFDKAITEAEQVERNRELEAIQARFIPAENGLTALANQDVVFLISKSKDLGGGQNSVLGAAVDTLQQLSGALRGVGGVTLSAKTWGKDKETSKIWIENRNWVTDASTTDSSDLKHFVPAAKELLMANTPDKPAGRQTHYIVICDSAIGDNVEQSAAMLGAVARFNPAVTFDFIVSGAEKGNVEGLAAEQSMQGVKFTRVTTPAEVAEAITKVVKTRFSENPAPAPVPPATPSDSSPKPAA